MSGIVAHFPCRFIRPQANEGSVAQPCLAGPSPEYGYLRDLRATTVGISMLGAVLPSALN